tara:strand:+ start:666 stop:887 length:222 start_codon:yes stop_codon:yes gene_type:complete
MAVHFDSIKDLANLDVEIRRVIAKDILEQKESKSGWAHSFDLHALQILRNQNDNKNLRVETCVAIGKKALKRK